MIDLQRITVLAIRSTETAASPKIEAIKWLRLALGGGLKEAKDMVEDAFMMDAVRFGEKYGATYGMLNSTPHRPLEDCLPDAQIATDRSDVARLRQRIGLDLHRMQSVGDRNRWKGKEAQIRQRAREMYEEGRKQVGGRPPWEKLDPWCPYDMGMWDKAIGEAIAEIDAAEKEEV